MGSQTLGKGATTMIGASSSGAGAGIAEADRRLFEAEAAAIFNNAALTAVLFGKKYVFMMIPNDKDMFEASDLFVPVTTNQHALNCKKEIEQILEIIVGKSDKWTITQAE